MSILIKGMEMPTDCIFCPMFHGAWTICAGLNKTTSVKGRPDDCPLVPVPPHGRLIDADALAEHKFVCIPHVSIDGKDAGTAYRLGWNTAIEAIMENAETIIGGE